MSDDSDEAIEREFDVAMAKAGAVVPAEWRAGALSAYKEMRRKTRILRQPRDASAEPSNVFSLLPFARNL